MRLGKWAIEVVILNVVGFCIAQSAIGQQPRYRLVDIGTLGGPYSYGPINGNGIPLLNNSGVVGSFADTASPDPTCFLFPDCFLAHAFRWKDGVITDLGALPGVNFSAAGSTNARGWMAGWSFSSTIDPNLGGPEIRAVLWKNGQIIDLGDLPGGTESIAAYVTDSGQVIGFSDNGVPDANSFFFFFTGTQIRTVLWENGSMRDVGTLGGASAFPGENCSGQPRNVVSGASFVNGIPNASTGVPTVEPFLWKDGVMISLGTLGGTIGSGLCPNNRGQVMGMSNLSGDVNRHGFLWENGTMKDLGTLGGPNSEVVWINDAGLIVGSADLPGDHLHDATVWKDGNIIDLGTVDGDACSRGYGLNALGQVVGGSSDCHVFLHAFIWEEGGTILDLNTLIAPDSGWQLTRAFNINDRGEILVEALPAGVTPQFEEPGHIVLLIPCDDASASSCGADHPKGPFGPASQSTPVRSGGADDMPRPRTSQENVAGWRAKFAKQINAPFPRR